MPNQPGWGDIALRPSIHGDTFSNSAGTAEFPVPSGTKFLRLIVTGAPTQHWIHVGRRGRGGPATNANTNEQWPYRFKLTGATSDDSTVH